MANEELDKSEDATPFKLREARKRGQVAKSLEVNLVIVVGSFFLALSLFSTRMAEHIENLVYELVRGGLRTPLTVESIGFWLGHANTAVLSIVGPIFFFVIIAAIVANVLQVKFVFSTDPLKPDFSRLNPAQGFKKIFQRRTIYELIKVILKLALLAGIVWFGGGALLKSLTGGVTLGLANPGIWLSSLVTKVMLLVVAAMVPIAIIDWIYSRRDFAHRLKMSKREVREEHKRHEGSPEIRARRKELQKQLREKSLSLGNVKEADLIVVNPTQYAVALKFRRETMNAPTVVAKGHGALAAEIRRRGVRYGKPVLRRPPLARRLFRECRINSMIPLDTFEPVAELYRWLYRNDRN